MAQKTVLEMTSEEEINYINRWMEEDTKYIPKDVKKLLSKHFPDIYEEDEFDLDDGELPECYDSRKSEKKK